MLIYGTGGHAKVVVDILLRNPSIMISAFFDDNKPDRDYLSYPVLAYDKNLFEGEKIIIAIGDNQARKSVADKMGHGYTKVVDLSSIVSNSSIIGDGCMVMHGAILQAYSSIGAHTIVNTGASIDHDCKIGEFVHIAPQVTLCGCVEIGEGTLVGAGTTIIPGKKIGKWVVIGAGSVVISDIPDYSVAVGNPAKVIKYLK